MKKFYEKPDVELISLVSSEAITDDIIDDNPDFSGGLEDNPFG